LSSPGPEILDSIKDLVQRRFKVRWAAAQLRKQGAALNRSQKGYSQTTRVGLAPEIPLVAHGLKAVADRRLPLVESLDEVITAIREAPLRFAGCRPAHG
jgi:hypothetical protein